MRIEHLDGLRGLAIIWVILFHSYSRWPEHLKFVSITQDIPIFDYGYLGVQLFFMISGFVIFMTLDKSKNYIDFIKRRWLRLFPAMLIATILIYSTAPFFSERPGGIPSLINIIPGLTFISPDLIKFFSGSYIAGLEGAFWSLYVEVVFYIFMGFIYFFIGRKYCIPALFLALSMFYFSLVLKKIELSWPYELITALGFPNYAWFIVGCTMYEFLNKRGNIQIYAITALSILLLFAPSVLNNKFNFTLISFYFGILTIFIFSFSNHSIQKILSNKPLILIGFVSYPLYLIHENILVATLIKLEKTSLPTSVILLMPIFISIVLVFLAYIIAKYLEPKLRKNIENLITPKPNNINLNQVKK